MDSEAERFFQEGKAAERQGDMMRAVMMYKKAERLGHDLLDAHERLSADEQEESDAMAQEWVSAGVCAKEDEQEDTPYLTEDQRATLERYPHALDYKFSEDELKQLDRDGYVVLKGLISPEVCERLLSECFEKLHRLYGLDKAKPETWKALGSGFSDVWHTPAYYAIRQDPRLYSVFAQLLKEPRLTLGLDRMSIKPPAYVDIPALDTAEWNPVLEDDPDHAPSSSSEGVFEQRAEPRRVEYKLNELPIHTDMNLWRLGESMYQGGLALQDCPKGNGGFVCLPGAHKLASIMQYREKFEAGHWHASDPSKTKKQSPPSDVFNWYLDPEGAKNAIEVPMAQGDFVVWSSRLPHCNALNQLPQWRVQCFVRHMPEHTHQAYRRMVERSARTGVKPNAYSTGGGVDMWNAGHEQAGYSPPDLSPLGRLLMGADPWST
eukprot:TRINITY_DN4679_c0_g1_i1.p1 TRINITY_DN4679_c0_g1~~TRINITY_DN4679_c0_g1_i1.p1  ORF type:complete len:434 (-),score=106.06 TRINITY_DN4679_c0_g1_i1:99-1400(-)